MNLVLFYEFLIWTTIINLACTLILWTLSTVEYKLPPPHPVTLLANVINRVSICNKVSDKKVQLPIGTEETSEPHKWQHIFVACNNIRTFLFMFIYAVGTLAYLTNFA